MVEELTGSIVSATEAATAANNLAITLGSVGKWLQAIGLIAIIWLIFQIITWTLNRKRLKRLKSIESKIDTLEKKINQALKK